MEKKRKKKEVQTYTFSWPSFGIFDLYTPRKPKRLRLQSGDPRMATMWAKMADIWSPQGL
jgi:hypothetical protein